MLEAEWRKKFAEKIVARLKELKMTQKELAEAIQLSDVGVSKIIHCARTPNGYDVYRMCKVLDCSPSYLFNIEFEREDKNMNRKSFTEITCERIKNDRHWLPYKGSMENMVRDYEIKYNHDRGTTFERLAEQYNLSKSRISVIIKQVERNQENGWV